MLKMSRLSWQRSMPLGLAALVAVVSQFGLSALAFAQTVDHDRIEALFQILQSQSIGNPALNLQPIASPAPFEGSAKPNTLFAAPLTTFEHSDAVVPKSAGGKAAIPSVPFSEIEPDGAGCPSKAAGFEPAIEELTKLVESYEERTIEFSMFYDTMDEEYLAYTRSDNSGGPCPADLRQKFNRFLFEVNEIMIADDILRAANLQLCAQTMATRLENDKEAIDRGDDPNRRLTLSRILDSISYQDARATDTLKRMVSLEQKRQRLISGIDIFEEQCETLDQY